MKIFAAIVMFVALCLPYRIVYPKQTEAKKGDDVPEKKEIDSCDVMGKSLFTRTDAATSQPTSSHISSIPVVVSIISLQCGHGI
jgi:hypothetical protein